MNVYCVFIQTEQKPVFTRRTLYSVTSNFEHLECIWRTHVLYGIVKWGNTRLFLVLASPIVTLALNYFICEFYISMKFDLHVTKLRLLFSFSSLFFLFLICGASSKICSLFGFCWIFGCRFVFRNGQAWPAVVLPHGRAHLPADLPDRALQSVDPTCRADVTDDSSSYLRGQAVDLWYRA